MTDVTNQRKSNMWYIKEGDLPSFPWKVTNGHICTDCRTKEDAVKVCLRYNLEEK